VLVALLWLRSYSKSFAQHNGFVRYERRAISGCAHQVRHLNLLFTNETIITSAPAQISHHVTMEYRLLKKLMFHSDHSLYRASSWLFL
jgi:hypothetical protein